MPVAKQVVKSCCGSNAIILQPEKPIKKYQVEVFRAAEYSIPASFYDAGIFYVQRNNLIASASFGTAKISLRTSKSTSEAEINEFINLLEQAVNS